MVKYNLFERFLLKKLSDTEVQDFEERLLTDSTFKKEFDEHKKLQNSFDLLLEEDILKVIRSNEKPIKSKSKKILYLKFFIKSAALFAILICAVSMINPAPSALDIVTEAKSYIDSKERGDDKDKTLPKEQLVLNSVHDMFESPISRSKMKDVISTLSKMDKSNLTIKDSQKTEWWMALAQVGVDKKAGKVFMIEIASKSNHLYSEKARDVLDKYSFFKRHYSKFSSL